MNILKEKNEFFPKISLVGTLCNVQTILKILQCTVLRKQKIADFSLLYYKHSFEDDIPQCTVLRNVNNKFIKSVWSVLLSQIISNWVRNLVFLENLSPQLPISPSPHLFPDPVLWSLSFCIDFCKYRAPEMVEN